MNLLGSTKGKITKNENGGNLPHLVLRKIVNDDYQQDSRVLYTFVPKKVTSSITIYFTKARLYSLKLLTQNFHILKYGLLIIVLNYLRQKTK